MICYADLPRKSFAGRYGKVIGMLKIAVLSLADINNYGDAFFPLVVRKELLKRLPDAEIEIVTNTNYNCGLYETKVYSKDYLSCFDAIILGGGELISPYDDKAFLDTYEGKYQVGGMPSDIAYGWLDLKKPFKAWFGVGAHPVLFEYPDKVEVALTSLDYLSVRGTISKKVLEGEYAHNNGNIRVMPDLGWLFPRYIDEYSFPQYLSVCKLKEDQPYIAFQAIDDLNIEKEVPAIAETLVSFQKAKKIRVMLVPVMQTKKQWSEEKVLQKILEAADGELTLLPSGLNILETGIILKNAKFFVGCSLHGAITSLAYGKPTVSIRNSINTKLQDVYAARCRATCFCNSWDVLAGVLERLNNEADNETDRKFAYMYAEYMRYRLEREFDNLASGIRKCKRI